MRTKTFTAAAALSLLVAGFALSSIRSPSDESGNASIADPGEIDAPPPIAAVLRRACYDCHSNRTRWPWYSHIAPVSWLVAHDVALGRRELNFSEWQTYYPQTRMRKLRWMERAVNECAMPPRDYLLMHRQARLNDAERAALTRWIESQIADASVSGRMQ